VTFLPLQVVALLFALAGPRPAPTPEEQRLFSAGLAAFDAGDAVAAQREWQAGYAIAHDPAFLVRIGEAQEKAKAPALALESYRRYLREAPDATDRADVEQRIARLAPPAAPPPAAEPVGELGAGPTATLPTTPAPRAEAAVDADAAKQDDDDGGWTGPRIGAWSATGATVALLGVAAYFGAQAQSHESDINRLVVFRDQDTGAPTRYTPEVARQYESAMADGRSDARTAKILLLSAAGTAVAATVFFIIDGTRAATGRVAIAPTPGSRGAVGAFTWTF
jgi:hypothetical protein